MAFDIRIFPHRVYYPLPSEIVMRDVDRMQVVSAYGVSLSPKSWMISQNISFVVTTCDRVFARQELRPEKRTLCSCKAMLFPTSAGEVAPLHATEIDTMATVFKQVRGDLHRECRLQLTSKTSKDLQYQGEPCHACWKDLDLHWPAASSGSSRGTQFIREASRIQCNGRQKFEQGISQGCPTSAFCIVISCYYSTMVGGE